MIDNLDDLNMIKNNPNIKLDSCEVEQKKNGKWNVSFIVNMKDVGLTDKKVFLATTRGEIRNFTTLCAVHSFLAKEFSLKCLSFKVKV